MNPFPAVPTTSGQRVGAPTLPWPINSIVVFRALMLGDLLCAVPALRALRHHFRDAQISLVGLTWARELVKRLNCVDEFIEFSGHPQLPERVCDEHELSRFVAAMQARRFDLALQMHGSGSIVNPLVASFGAKHSAGFFNDASRPSFEDAAYYVAWPEQGHEIERMLTLSDWLGAARQGTDLEFPLHTADRAALAVLWPNGKRPAAYVCLHAGAQLPSRRWPVERFAAVGDRLAAEGMTVVLTGAAQEAPLVAAVSAAMAYPAINFVGGTNLWTLGALLEGARLLVSNDTGVSHIAAALKTPSVIVSSGSDVSRWAPLNSDLHRVLWQPMACRPCTYRDCPIGHDCATAIGVDEVMQTVRRQLMKTSTAASGSSSVNACAVHAEELVA